MNSQKLKVGIACSAETHELYIGKTELVQLREFADVSFIEIEDPNSGWVRPSLDEELEAQMCQFVEDLDALIVCHGAPYVSERVIAAAPHLKLIGDLEGDRFAHRIDTAAAHEAGVVVVDTTHSSSWPVSEWALALILVGLRQQARFRDIIEGKEMSHDDYRTDPPARELTGRTVGLIGFGRIAWRLREFLAPFRVRVIAHDPFAPRELADALDVDFAPLDKVMECEIVVCLAPQTPTTVGMIGARELDLLPEDAVFVNVSRGLVVDRPALEAKAAKNDAWFGLDAHDPEPIAVDTPLRGMRNVFLSPHIGGMTVEAQPRFFELMVRELARFHEGVEPRAELTPRALQGRGTAVGAR
ncbi:NAD(P)-dependent oxidoreductase [Microbacterium sp. Mu-80]|uniref:NAD(P)-dependent oxidoreductase n=1 Tax=Microbacterium bandirmense TaxID=3122050 RepID=A0ABU8LBU0_9MICO